MKEIQLTQGQVALVDDADFDWLNQWKWYAGKDKFTFYARREVVENGKEKCLLMHRLILGIHNTKAHGDHEDGNGLNNQRYNLRSCTNQENMMNRRQDIGSGTSKYKGVYWNKRARKWISCIRHNGKLTHLGSFSDEIDAAKAYNAKAPELFGQFARLNQV